MTARARATKVARGECWANVKDDVFKSNILKQNYKVCNFFGPNTNTIALFAVEENEQENQTC